MSSSNKFHDIKGFSSNFPERTEPLNLSGYVPFFLGAIANRWTAASSKAYRQAFDLGIGEWRILASLAALGDATSLSIARLVKMDAGAVSRAIRLLEDRHLVIPLPGRFSGRSKPYRMTEQGLEIFEALKAMALEREQKLLKPLAPREKQELLSLLARLYDQLDELEC